MSLSSASASPSPLTMKAFMSQSRSKVYCKYPKAGTAPTWAGSAMAHHLEHIHFIQLRSRTGFVLELGLVLGFLFWFNFSLRTADCTDARRWQVGTLGTCTVHAKYTQVSCGLERTLQLWVKRDQAPHARSEYVYITHSSQLAINPRSKLESFRV